MPIIKNKVIRNIPEQVAKNTSDILALMGGIDYSQAPFLGASPMVYRNSQLELELNFAEGFVPVYLYMNIYYNNEEVQVGFCLTRNTTNGSFDGHVLEIAGSSDIALRDDQFSLHTEDHQKGCLIFYFDCDEPFDKTEFKDLSNVQYILSRGEIDQ